MDISLESIDELFQSYNYQIAPASNNKLRIYTLRYGMYHAAELIKFDESFDESSIKAEYSENGYATEVKVFSSKEEIEEYLLETDRYCIFVMFFLTKMFYPFLTIETLFR